MLSIIKEIFMHSESSDTPLLLRMFLTYISGMYISRVLYILVSYVMVYRPFTNPCLVELEMQEHQEYLSASTKPHK